MGCRSVSHFRARFQAIGSFSLCKLHAVLMRCVDQGKLVVLHLHFSILQCRIIQGLSTSAVLVHCNPKHQRSLGKYQVASLRGPLLLRWLTRFSDDAPSQAHMFPGGTSQFRRLMDQALTAFELSQVGFRPSRLRPGGTTELYFDNYTISRIRFMGRWRCFDTLDHHVQDAWSVLVLFRIEPSIIESLNKLVKVGLAKFANPPVDSWCCFFDRSK